MVLVAPVNGAFSQINDLIATRRATAAGTQVSVTSGAQTRSAHCCSVWGGRRGCTHLLLNSCGHVHRIPFETKHRSYS